MTYFTYKYKGTDLIHLEWYGQKVCNYFGPIISYLESKNLVQDSFIFCSPQILESDIDHEVYMAWTSEVVDQNAKSIIELAQEEQIKALELLNEFQNSVKKQANLLLESEQFEKVKFGQLLLKAVQFPDHSFVFYQNGKIILSGWGLITVDNNQTKVLSLEKLLRSQEKTKIQHKSEDEDQFNNSPSVPKLDDKLIPASDYHKKIDHKENHEKANEIKEIFKSSPEGTVQEDQDVNYDRPVVKKRDLLYWFKRFLLIVFLLLALYFIYFLFSSDAAETTQADIPISTGSLEIPFPKMKVIDPRKIEPGPGQDSIFRIVTDRLNLAIVGENKNINTLIDSLQANFDTAKFNVVYTNQITNRIQIEADFNYLMIIQKSIKQKVGIEKVLSWFERIFSQNITFNDPGLKNQNFSWYLENIQAIEAWDITTGDSNLTIAVLDSGFDLDHDELKNKYMKGFDISKLQELKSSVDDHAMHGTHVASLCLGSSNNGSGVCGVAPSCTLMPVKVSDDYGNIAASYIIDGILYAIKNGARVINISLGADLSMLSGLSIEQQKEIANSTAIDEADFWNELFKIAESKNITIVLAAGNNHVLTTIDPMKRSSNVIIVSASNQNNEITKFSSFGSSVNITAPGENIYSAINGNQYKMEDGTSMASPIVAGACALIISKKPSITTTEILELFRRTGKACATTGEPIGPIIQLENALKQLN
ncbi:MAG TPA: S8 family serine peptidase [Saprospiraceae bacterium]|nr:S8 family serine peptidase [Saprospiraceae bacterium]